MDNVEHFAPEKERQHLRMLEALLFAAQEPLSEIYLANRLPEGVDLEKLLKELQTAYSARGVNLVRVADKWAFRTAQDLAYMMRTEAVEQKKLSRAALETLAIIAYHQPVTRAEIEDIRGVSISKGTLDVLLETGWVRMRGRRRTPGRPITYGSTEQFLDHFVLDSIRDLPGLEELRGSGLLETGIPSSFAIPNPSDDPELADDEDPLEDFDLMEHLDLSDEKDDMSAEDGQVDH